jgi:hypothetical protein
LPIGRGTLVQGHLEPIVVIPQFRIIERTHVTPLGHELWARPQAGAA